MLDFLWRGRRWRKSAHALYFAAVTQARTPWFYQELGVADTVDGRFDLVVLHCFMLLYRLKQGGSAALSQALFDIMFEDMDQNLRELGASDLGVGRKVKTMAKAFLGRVAAYDAALGDGKALEAALARNLYRGQPVNADALTAMAGYVTEQVTRFATQDIADLEEGRVTFFSPVTP